MAIETKPDISVKWAAQGATTQPTNSKTRTGWVSEIPTYQAQNWWQNRVDSFLNHVNQAGIPVWDGSTQYTANSSFVQYGGELYLALQDNSNVTPGTNASVWRTYIDATRLVPVGQVDYFVRQSPPNGWLECNGAAINRIAYADLFSVIGTSFGNGNGSTTFNLPDFRAEFLRGWDHGRGVDSGRDLFSSQSSANISHTHVGSAMTAGNHQHGGTTSNAGNHQHNGTTDGAGDHTHFFQLYERQGAGQTNKVADSGGRAEVGATTSAAGWHQHTFWTSWSGDHNHGFTTNSAGDHTHQLSITSSGGSESRPRNVALLVCIKF